MKNKSTLLLAVALICSFAHLVDAALIDQGNGLIYDPDRNTTWLKEANVNGRITWDDAVDWADNLVFANASNWRLPTTPVLDTDCSNQQAAFSFGVNCTAGEMEHLFSAHGSELGLFNNLLTGADQGYWTATEFPLSAASAFLFYFGVTPLGTALCGASCSGEGALTTQIKLATPSPFAMAVHDGQIGAGPNPIPEPSTVLLLGTGLLGLVGYGHRRRKAA